ncbi:DUF397 domain-containing protein [Embleya sp. NPDC059259]|uniref:DUF397 domain-containing protein n=2 Tax=Embleya TaxID=2699295 RepID=UPI00368F1E98
MAACPTAAKLPRLLGVGPISAAQILAGWSHAGRFRSEAAFASFAGAAPIPAPFGPTDRHRLGRDGDRQLDRALRTITVIGMPADSLSGVEWVKSTASNAEGNCVELATLPDGRVAQQDREAARVLWLQGPQTRLP